MEKQILRVILGLAAVAAAWGTAQAQLPCEMTRNPAEVQIITDDLRNFLKALERIESGAEAEAAFRDEYISKASPGLKEYLAEFGLEAADFAEIVSRDGERFSSLKALPDLLSSQEASIGRLFDKLSTLYPETVYIPFYYFVGRQKGFFAQPSPYGITVSISELADDMSLVGLGLVHETVHVQQALAVGIEEYMQIFGPKMSLLAVSIREGAAYFLTTLVSGRHTLPEARDYFLKNKAALWERFLAEADNRDPGDWMYHKPADGAQPRDVGYIVGAEIVESYFERSEDKVRAVKEILSVVDYRDFLEKSGYKGI